MLKGLQLKHHVFQDIQVIKCRAKAVFESSGSWEGSGFNLGSFQRSGAIPNDNSGPGFGLPAETIENDAVFDRFGAAEFC